MVRSQASGAAMHDAREHFLNTRLAARWAGGALWARLDVAGLELPGGGGPHSVRQVCFLTLLCSALLRQVLK